MADFTIPRITEKRYLPIPPQLFTADGTNTGTITILNTYSFKVGQLVILKSNTQSGLKVKIQKVISETQLIVVNIDEAVTTKNKLDISMFLLADTATVELLEDKRPVIDLNEIQRQVYEEEPTVAIRTHSVDWLGRPYDKTNPFQVQLSDGSINIGTVNAELEVQLSHKDDVPNPGDVADSVRIGDGVNELAINPDGSINANTNIVFPTGLATEAKQDVGNTSLSSIDAKLEAENIKQKILKAVDRQQDLIYADFGTKNQRITEINYNATSVGVTVAKKTITYTLVGNKYRRDSIDWSIV